MTTASSWGLLALYLAILIVTVKPMGLWLAAVAEGRLPGPLARAEAAAMRALHVPTDEMDWKAYALGTLAISAIGVLVFAGLTAYDTQQIKEMYQSGDDSETTGKKAILGALNLYMDFINLFLMLLRLFANRD